MQIFNPPAVFSTPATAIWFPKRRPVQSASKALPLKLWPIEIATLIRKVVERPSGPSGRFTLRSCLPYPIAITPGPAKKGGKCAFLGLRRRKPSVPLRYNLNMFLILQYFIQHILSQRKLFPDPCKAFRQEKRFSSDEESLEGGKITSWKHLPSGTPGLPILEWGGKDAPIRPWFFFQALPYRPNVPMITVAQPVLQRKLNSRNNGMFLACPVRDPENQFLNVKQYWNHWCQYHVYSACCISTNGLICTGRNWCSVGARSQRKRMEAKEPVAGTVGLCPEDGVLLSRNIFLKDGTNDPLINMVEGKAWTHS